MMPNLHEKKEKLKFKEGQGKASFRFKLIQVTPLPPKRVVPTGRLPFGHHKDRVTDLRTARDVLETVKRPKSLKRVYWSQTLYKSIQKSSLKETYLTLTLTTNNTADLHGFNTFTKHVRVLANLKRKRKVTGSCDPVSVR